MTLPCARRLAVVLSVALLPVAALAAGVSVRDDDSASPFPSNRHTVADFGNATFRRVNLPKPDCAVRVSDCQDIDVINTLDGFSTQPRITVPFTGAIDPASVTSDTVFLYNLAHAEPARVRRQGGHQPDPLGPGEQDVGVRARRAARRALALRAGGDQRRAAPAANGQRRHGR
jgi:hypothetical protein